MSYACFAALTLILSGCTSLFYHPDDHLYVDPVANKIDFRDVFFTTDDNVRLHGWYLPRLSETTYRRVVVHLHGNAQNVSSHFLGSFWYREHGYDVLAVDYRGYGKSAGSPSPLGLRRDALAAFRKAEELRRDAGGGLLVVLGQSLGGAVALDALLTPEGRELAVDRLILEGSFAAYSNVARAVVAKRWFTWWLQPIVPLLVNDSTSPKGRASQWQQGVLVAHGQRDSVVPFSQGQALFAALGEPKYWLPVADADHLEVAHVRQGAVRSALLRYIQEGRL